jgi:hypothetical protein
VHDFVARKGIPVFDHPLYSPDLAPADLRLFPKVKLAMKGDRHKTTQYIQRECTAVVNVIPKKEYSDCFKKLFNLFQLCTDSQGEYFENNSRLAYLLNTMLTEPGHTVYT